MRAQNQKTKTKKSLTKKQINKSKTISTNKSTSLKLNNKITKAKSKNKEIKPKSKSRPKTNQIKLDNSNLELNLNNYLNNTNYISADKNNNYHYIPNNDIYNNYNSVGDLSLNNTNQFKNSLINSNNNNFDSVNILMTSNQENGKQNAYKRTIDRLIINSQNLLEKQNNILLECDTLTKNAATNDYAIQNLINNDSEYNNENILEKYNNNILEILSRIKKNNSKLEINAKLKSENESLKNKLELANINKEEYFQIISNELTSLKLVLVNEINHVFNLFKEIGYDNISQDKMEIGKITSQKISDFFQLMIKIIKQMKELIQNKETIISKMTIDQVTNRSNFDNINKSYEKLNFDNINNNIGYKTYNFSVRNNLHNKTYNISFRNMTKNNKNEDLISKTQKSLNINEFQNSNKYLEENKLKYSGNKISDELVNNYNENRQYNNENNNSERNYQTGNFGFKDILNINQNK